MKYILQRILIGTCIALCVWFIKDTCFAATIVDQYVYRTVYRDQVCVEDPLHPGEYACSNAPGSSQQTSTFTQFGNQTSGPKKIYQYYVRMGTPSTTTSQFQSNQTCTTTFDINYNPRNSQTTSTLEGIPTFQYFNGSDYVDLDNGRMSIVQGSDDYSYKVSFTYTPTTQTRYIYVNLNLPAPVVRGSSSQAVNFRNGTTVCATSSTDTAIIEGTSQIVDSINGIGGQLNDSTSLIQAITPSFVYNTRYDVLGQSIGSVVDDGLGETLSVDLSYWDDPFSFLWGIATQFINIDSKLFLVLTTILTFSFVGLVFNR